MAIIRFPENRNLVVKETVEEINALLAAGAPFNVTQVREEVIWKSPTPVDTKVEKKFTTVTHTIMPEKVVIVQPTEEEIEAANVTP